MKFKILIVIIIFFFGILNVNIYSKSTASIKGIVVDFDTGEPIQDAEVFLLCQYSEGLLVCNSKKTDKKGKYKFDNLNEGIYAINVMKDGYATLGKIADLRFEHLLNSNPPLLNGFVIPDDTNTIPLKKGQIKYVQPRLKKEAVLIINVSHKYPEGISYFGNRVSHKSISFDHSEYDEPERNIPLRERYRSKNWGAGIVKVFIQNFICPDSRYEVALKNGETTEIDHVLDYTKGPIIYGRVFNKTTNEPVVSYSISIRNLADKRIRFSVYTDGNGNYLFGNIPPGNYLISCFPETKEVVLNESDQKKILFYIE